MNKVQEIFAKYCANQYLISEYEQFLDYTINDENEVISLSIFDSYHHGDFPFVDNLALFISNFKQLKQLEIDVWGKTIATFQPLQDLKALETIFVEANTVISDLSFVKQMKNLKSIYLQNSDIQDISELINNKELTYVALPFSKIRDISPLQKLTELKAINFNNNQITNIDCLKYCQKLENIDLNNNQIQSVDSLQSLYELKKLSISNNQITNVNALRYLNKIQFLELRNNQISDIDFLDNFEALNNLNISNNKVKKISSIKGCKQLQFLSIAENEIENIDFLNDGNALLRLNIAKNPIRSVEVLSRLKCLEVLIAAYVDFQIRENFQFQSQFKTLILNHCNIKNIDFLLNQKGIVQLKLSNNQISNIDGFEGFNRLKNLNLQHNQIIEIIPYQFLSLIAIDLRGNEFGNQLFGNFSGFYGNAYTHYTHIFEAIQATENRTIQDLRRLIAEKHLEKGENEAALAAFYFDDAEIYPNIKRDFLDIRIYLLKHLSNQNSPFVFTLQERLQQTLQLHFASTETERKLRNYYADLIENIADRNIEKPSINEDNYTYFFYERKLENEAVLEPILERLFKEEKALMSDVLEKSKLQPKRKRYERKTTSHHDSSEFAGCIVWLGLMLVLGVMIYAEVIPTEALKALVFIVLVIKAIFHFAMKR